MDFVKRIFLALARRGFTDWMGDETYLKIKYWACTGRRLDLSHPATFNEKLQWLKLHDRKREYTDIVDKYKAKEYVGSRIGYQYIIPTLGVWDCADDIDFEALPSQFVLKCTHDSGGLVICRDKSVLDIPKVREKLNHYMKRNYYALHREWPYRNVPHRILAEQYMEEPSRDRIGTVHSLTDYKVFCFSGKPQVIMTVRGGHESERGVVRRMYDPSWNKFEVGLHGKENVPEPEPKPEKLDEMLNLAEILSRGFAHIRVDFYIIGGEIYFSEMTFYHMSGYEKFKPESFDMFLGDYINLDFQNINEEGTRDGDKKGSETGEKAFTD